MASGSHDGSNVGSKDRSDDRKGELKLFISYFKPHRKLFFLDMTCALMISLIDLGFPYVSRWCMYTLIPQGMWKTFWSVMGIVCLAYVLRSVFYYIISYWGHTFGILVEADIRRDLFRHMQELSFSYFDNNRVGQLMSRLTADLFDITELAHHGPEDLFISMVTIVGSLIIMFSIQWRLALVIALMIPMFVAVVWRCRRSMSEASAKVKQTTAAINADIESGLSGIKTAKAFANESAELQKFDSSNASFKTSKSRFYKAMGRFNAAMEFSMCMLSAAVIAAGGALIMQGQLNTIDLITFSLYVTAFINPIRKLSNFAELFANGTAGLHRFAEIMKTTPGLTDAPDAAELKDVKGSVDIDRVHFAYQNGIEILHGITLHIAPGEMLALVGPSGGGKTTLCQLIPRFYDVAGGAVRIDGQDVRSVTQESLHRNIGIVQQDVFLFADSFAENIRYGCPDADMEEIVRAAKMAEIYDDIAAMPDGFDTNVGERGVLLSGGQKQRISIARIFLKNPPILILDEATSALDSVTEAKIQKTFEKLSAGRTTIVIAHRLSTVRNASRIAVIHDGSVIELGTHRELMDRNGAYAELVRSQELKE
jgi:ATP-binding cassette subfamily B protein